MEVTNTLAYYDMSTVTTVKSFVVQAPGVMQLTSLELREIGKLPETQFLVKFFKFEFDYSGFNWDYQFCAMTFNRMMLIKMPLNRMPQCSYGPC
jgi:hypothetical protein